MFLDSETGLKHTQTRDVKTIVEFYILQFWCVLNAVCLCFLKNDPFYDGKCCKSSAVFCLRVIEDFNVPLTQKELEY